MLSKFHRTKSDPHSKIRLRERVVSLPIGLISNNMAKMSAISTMFNQITIKNPLKNGKSSRLVVISSPALRLLSCRLATSTSVICT